MHLHHWCESILWEGKHKIFKVRITLLRLSRWVLFYLCLWVVSSLDTTGSKHMVNRNIRLFLIPMPIALLCLLNFLFFWVLPMPFFLNCIQALLSIVSFCVRDVFTFKLIDGEEILAYYFHVSDTSFWYVLLLLGVLTLNNFKAFKIMA